MFFNCGGKKKSKRAEQKRKRKRKRTNAQIDTKETEFMQIPHCFDNF